jgi:hypothetical protein
VDGVIAFDQDLVPLLLEAIGPVRVSGAPQPIMAQNVIQYMRDSYSQNLKTDRKAFIAPLARAILERLAADPDTLSKLGIVRALGRALDERHLLVYLRDPNAAAALARRGWDGAVRPGANDFLMVVDSNLGYNKVNPNIREALAYSVDLNDLRAPMAELSIRHDHRLHGPGECQHSWHARVVRYEDFFVGCYWDYLRALVPEGSRLVAATAQPVPGEWLPRGVSDDGAARLAAGEANTSVISAFLVVPIGGRRETIFRYSLPAAVLVEEPEGWRYRLALQKQAGIDTLPVMVTIQLPVAAVFVSASGAPAVVAGQSVSFQFDLSRDRQIEVAFRT